MTPRPGCSQGLAPPYRSRQTLPGGAPGLCRTTMVWNRAHRSPIPGLTIHTALALYAQELASSVSLQLLDVVLAEYGLGHRRLLSAPDGFGKGINGLPARLLYSTA